MHWDMTAAFFSHIKSDRNAIVNLGVDDLHDALGSAIIEKQKHFFLVKRRLVEKDFEFLDLIDGNGFYVNYDYRNGEDEYVEIIIVYDKEEE